MPRTLPITIASTLTIAAAASGQVLVDGSTSYFAGSQPSGVAAADFDGDGDLDLATTVDGPDRIQILLNAGNGTYATGPMSLIPNSSSPQDLVTADFDGNGTMDLAIAVRDPQGSVLIYSGTGFGTFVAAGSVAVGDRPRGLSVGDIDNDGDIDLAVANRNDDTAHVLINQGGSFTATMVATGAEPRKTTLGDYDGDGDLDLAVTQHDDRTIGVYTNNGGAFALSQTLFMNPAVRPEGIDSGDIDGDGDIDLAVATSDATLNINEIQMYTNNGGSFIASAAYATGGQNTGHVILADLDCDGWLDAAATNNNSANASIIPNLGGGVFGAPIIIATGAGTDEITVGDADGDGDLDIMTANRDSNNLSVIQNGSDCATGTPGDVDGDGVVGFSDLIELLAAWGMCKGCPADLDGNGIVDFGDLVTVLDNWTA